MTTPNVTPHGETATSTPPTTATGAPGSTASTTSAASTGASSAARLGVEGLSVRFQLADAMVQAVTGASFEVSPGRCLALVGESGCGKSVMAHALLGLLPGNAEVRGSAWLESGVSPPVDLLRAPERVLARQVRGRRIGLIPQSPAAHLTPVRTARAQLEEALRELDTGGGDPSGAADRLADRAGLHPRDLDHYPHELSGGMAQRVANAVALAGDPWLLIADEPTTGLDQALVARTMTELRRLCDEGRAVLLITHDLAAAEQVADDVAVMYASRLVELAPAADFFAQPRHPYAAGLLDALPSRGFAPIPGLPPELTRLPGGCAFAPRCPHADGDCGLVPALTRRGGRLVACHHPQQPVSADA